MAFTIDFNTSTSDQKVTDLIAKLDKLKKEANAASLAMTPRAAASESYAKMDAQIKALTESSKKLTEKVKELKTASVNADKEKESSAKKWSKTLETTIEKHTHQLNAMNGAYGKNAQSMVKASIQIQNETRKKSKTIVDAANAEKKALDETKTAHNKALAANLAFDKARAAETQRAHGQAISANRLFEERKLSRTKAAHIEALAMDRKFNSERIKIQAGADKVRLSSSRAINANIAASARAGMAALGTSFGIYTAGTLAAAVATYTLLSAMSSAVSSGIEFEQSMYRAFAVTGKMGTAYKENGNIIVSTSAAIMDSQKSMARTAIEASKVTTFTASEAAEGLVALGMSGLTSQQAMGALGASLQLAQVGMIDVYTSADIMTNVMLGFGMSINTYADAMAGATKVSDVLASSITNSNATIKEMSRSLSYVAPIAHAAGSSIEETTAILETFHNVGIKSQRAGTAARRAFTNLLAPTEKVGDVFMRLGVDIFQTSGKMRSMIDILTDLKAAGAGAAEMEQLFGVRAAAAMVALMNNIEATREEFERLKTDATGASAAMADFMASSTAAQQQILLSKLQAKYQDIFSGVEDDLKTLNRTLFDLVDYDLDGVFSGMESALENSLIVATALVKMFQESDGNGGFFGGAMTPAGGIYDALIADENNQLGTFLRFGEEAASMMWQGIKDYSAKDVDRGLAEDWAKDRMVMIYGTDGLTDSTKELTGATSKYSHVSAESHLALKNMEASLTRSKDLAKAYADALSDDSFKNFATTQKRIAGIQTDDIRSKQKLGLITERESIVRQLQVLDNQQAALDKNKITRMEEFAAEGKKIEDALIGVDSIRRMSELGKETKKYLDQLVSQNEQIARERVKLTLGIQEDMMKAAGFNVLSESIDKAMAKIQVANAKLRGDKQAGKRAALDSLTEDYAKQGGKLTSQEYRSTLSDDQLSSLEKEYIANGKKLSQMEDEIDLNHRLTEAMKQAKKFKSEYQDIKDADKLVVSLEVANEKLRGNKQASMEAKLAALDNSVAQRELAAATGEFSSLSDKAQKAFVAETAAMKAQASVATSLISQNRLLTESKKAHLAAVKASKKFDNLEDLEKEIAKLEVANAKLKGNTGAKNENTFATMQNVIAKREAAISSGDLSALTEEEKKAFVADTQAMKENIDVLGKLVDENVKLTSSKKALSKFGKGTALGDEGKGTAKYLEALDQLKEYETNRLDIVEQFGLEEIDFANMITEAKIEAAQAYWDSQHEHLASWRDDWAKSVGDNVEAAVLAEQHWSEAAQNIAATMLGTVVNTMAEMGAQKAAQYAMDALFSSGRVAMETTEAAVVVSGEVAKSAAKATTATAESLAGNASILMFGEMSVAGAALGAALGPAAMFFNILTFGAAGIAAAGSMALNGVVTAAAGVVAGVASGAGESIAGGRALGGRVSKGVSYKVGEAGEEVFTPDSSGFISNHQDAKQAMGNNGGGGTQVNIENKYYIDAKGNEDLEQRFNEAIITASNLGHQKVVKDFAENGTVAKIAKRNARA